MLQDSSIPTYAKMWTAMEQNSKVFAKSNQEGIDRVLKDDGLYAFMMESTVSENHTNFLPRNVLINLLPCNENHAL